MNNISTESLDSLAKRPICHTGSELLDKYRSYSVEERLIMLLLCAYRTLRECSYHGASWDCFGEPELTIENDGSIPYLFHKFEYNGNDKNPGYFWSLHGNCATPNYLWLKDLIDVLEGVGSYEEASEVHPLLGELYYMAINYKTKPYSTSDCFHDLLTRIEFISEYASLKAFCDGLASSVEMHKSFEKMVKEYGEMSQVERVDLWINTHRHYNPGDYSTPISIEQEENGDKFVLFDNMSDDSEMLFPDMADVMQNFQRIHPVYDAIAKNPEVDSFRGEEILSELTLGSEHYFQKNILGEYNVSEFSLSIVAHVRDPKVNASNYFDNYAPLRPRIKEAFSDEILLEGIIWGFR